MNKENTTVEEGKKKFPVREISLVLAGIIVGIVISYGLFASAVKGAVDDVKTEQTSSKKEDKTVSKGVNSSGIEESSNVDESASEESSTAEEK